ncbi:hypothetical protein EJB05_29580, partial [Eragrostis curvula]
MIEVVLNDRLGKKVRVKCNEDDTIGDLKKLVAAQTGTRPEKIRIQKWYNIYKDHITLRTTTSTTAWASSSTTTRRPAAAPDFLQDIMNDGVISCIPFSDGKDDESWPKHSEERGQPITCIVCTLSMPVVFKVPLAVYWIQPAATLATYYHYFHGHNELILRHISRPTYEVSFPGLHSVKIRNMPTLFTENKPTEVSKIIMQALQELFQYMDQERPIVLVNTFAALEDVALNAIRPYMDVFAIGPAIPPLGALQVSEAQIHLFKQDEKDYIEWLNIQSEKSVVYLSFGSLLTYTKRQVEEISYGLQECGRPYLWVVRKEGCAEEVDFILAGARGEQRDGRGLVRPAASIVASIDRVLRHSLWMELNNRGYSGRCTNDSCA